MLSVDGIGEQGVVYLLHYDAPIGNPDNRTGQAQHYIGWARNLDGRLWHHAHGNGAEITKAFVKAGIGFTLARTWCGTKYLERAKKRQGGASRFCPICKGRPPMLAAA